MTLSALPQKVTFVSTIGTAALNQQRLADFSRKNPKEMPWTP